MGKLYIFKTFPQGLREVKLTPKAKLMGRSTMLNNMATVSLNFDQTILRGKGEEGGHSYHPHGKNTSSGKVLIFADRSFNPIELRSLIR